MPGGEAIVEVEVRDSLRDVLTRLPTGGLARLHIPPNSPLFVTAAEFGALKDAADRAGVDVVVHTADPLRLQLGRMLGLATVASAPSPRSTPPAPPPRHERPGPAAAPAAPAPTSSPPPPPPPPNGDRPGGASVGAPTVPDGAVAPVVARDAVPPPTMTRLVRQVLDRQAEPAPTSDAPVPETPRDPPPAENLPRAGFDDEPDPLGPVPGRTWASIVAERRAKRGAEDNALPARRAWPVRPSRLAAVGAAMLAVILAAGAAVALLPQATVTITLARKPVDAELVYAIAPPGTTVDGADLVVEGASVSLPVAVAATVPTTGVRREPDAAASGRVRLSNPNPEPVRIAAGTTLAGVDGVEFAFVGDVEVPAGAPAEGRFGAAEADVRAVEPGGAGNLETGALGGRLPSGVYFSNRDGPMSGGSDREIPVVAAADLAALRGQLEAALPKQAEEAFTAELPDGTTVAASSLTFGDIDPTYDRQEGEEAEEVRAEATVTVTALTYQPQAAEAQVRSALRDRLTIPAGHEIDEASLALGEPRPIDPAGVDGAVRYRVAATAIARAAFTDEQRRDLADDLVGKGAADAEATIRQIPGVEAVEASYRPSWFPDRMPRWSGAIDVETDP